MSAVQALGAARAFGIRLELDGDDLLLEASRPPPDAVLDALSRHKPEVVRLLHSAKDGSSPEYWHVLFHQRVTFAEFDGRLPRTDAEAQAFECCIYRVARSKSDTLWSWPLRVVWSNRSQWCCRRALRDGAGDAHLVARGMLANLARDSSSSGEGGSNSNGHRRRAAVGSHCSHPNRQS
jgi:hypothetical protein